MADYDEHYIQRYYDGDVERFKYETADFDRHAIPWKKLQAYNDCNEDQKKFVRNVSFWRLGFNPCDRVMIAITPYLCEVVNDFLNDDVVTWKRFQNFFDDGLKLVRSEHLFRNGWLDHLELSTKDYTTYESFMPHLKDAARKLLQDFVGYDLELKHSLYAELMIRNTISETSFDQLHLHNQIELRHQVITIVKYLETLHQHGRCAADALPHFGFNWTDDIWKSIH